MAETSPRALTSSVYISASPPDVWRVIADVRRTGEWSPECVGVTPIGGVRRGALMLGRNKRGRIRWITLSRIVEYEPGVVIGWTVLTNRSCWRYALQPATSGTTVIQTRRTPRGQGRFALWFTRAFLDGQDEHDDELEAGMTAGLERIKLMVEAAPTR